MSRRGTLLLAGAGLSAVVVAAAYFGARSAAIAMLKQVPPASETATSNGRVGDAAYLWPTDRGWTWTAPPPPVAPGGDRLALVVRERSSPRGAPGVSPVLTSDGGPMPAGQADRTFGVGGVLRPPGGSPSTSSPWTASVQLVDLTELGVASDRPGQNLRVLATFFHGGATTRLPSDEIYLPAGRFAGRTIRHDSTWANGAFHLMSFQVLGESRLYQYDVIVEQTTDRLP